LLSLQKDIEAVFTALCHKLDALSNFHYTPKAPSAEIQVVANVPAISMEEILPMATSEKIRQAPEEVFDKKHGRCVCPAILQSRTM
jgi:U3 small nucleolar RNA-associated protein MPP10